MKRNIFIYLSYYKNEKNGCTAVTRWADLDLYADTALCSIINFEKEAKQIFKEAKKIADAGQCWNKFTITSSKYDDAYNVQYCNGWFADDCDAFATDDNGKEFCYFQPELSTDTPEYHDMEIYLCRLFDSLAENNI